MTTTQALDAIKAAARETGADFLIRIRADPKYEELGEQVRIWNEHGEGVGTSIASAWEDYLEE